MSDESTLETRAKEASQKLVADMKADRIHFIQFTEGGKFTYIDLNLAPAFVSFAHSEGDQRYREGLEAALALCSKRVEHFHYAAEGARTIPQERECAQIEREFKELEESIRALLSDEPRKKGKNE